MIENDVIIYSKKDNDCACPVQMKALARLPVEDKEE